PPRRWLLIAVKELLLALLMPNGVSRVKDRSDGVDDIADSDLPSSLKSKLIDVRHALAPYGSFHEIVDGKGTRLKFIELLKDAMDAIQDVISTDGGNNESKRATPTRETPDWEGTARVLRFQGRECKRFRKPASHQEKILSAFQEENWPEGILDPLPTGS